MAAAAVTMVVILVAVVSLWLQIIPSQAIKVKLVPRDFSHTSAVQGSVTSDNDYDGGVWSYLAGLSDADRVQRAIQRSRTREAAIQRRIQYLRVNAQVLDDDSTEADDAAGWSSNYKAPVSPGSGEFLLKTSMGTPALEYEMILDTGSNLIWTQCEPCNNCFKQSSTIFDPTKSSSYKASACDSDSCNGLPEGQSSCNSNQCGYEYSYGDGSNTTGVMGTDTFKLSGMPLPGIAFGCGNDNNGFNQGAGLVGFGRGKLSLPTQFAQSVNADAVFAYCLVEASSGSSPMWLGSDAAQAFPSDTKAVSTPFISNKNMDTFYYVTLTGIKVGNTPVNIPAGAFDIQSDGSGGLIVDSGTTLTYLESQTEQNLINALKSAINLNTADGSSSVGLDLCYDSSSNTDNFPTVTFTFQGEADMEMTPSNYLIQQNNLLCVAFAAASGQGSVSILGNIAQMDFLVLYDTAQDKLSFAKTKCESLS